MTASADSRRTFAIISHPDAGKTTLTEKLLLYAGAIEEAGAVKARAGRQRDVTSDWMELERRRGISITSTVLQFEYRDHVLNLLDTPGHRDFSEDTYRVLSAVDAAIIVLDAAKGIESQTLKLFQVARRRGIPLITFVNKCDRPGMNPLELLDDIESTLGLHPTPVTWPVGSGTEFTGVVYRPAGEFWRFERTAHGARSAEESRHDLSSGLSGAPGAQASEELELLSAVDADHSPASFLSGDSTPVFFGSALWNFGVRLLLNALIDVAPAPKAPHDGTGHTQNLDGECSAQVFKIQANLDPRHRDRVAFVRLWTGAFERGMALVNARTGRPFATKYANQIFGRRRDTVERALAGDVLGLVNAGDLRIGDTLSETGRITYPPIPTFAPEHFMTARNLDTSRYKQFRAGIGQLEEEGVIQVLRHPDQGDQQPILAAVGPMQYDVTLYRLQTEYGARADLSPTPFTIARVVDREAATMLSRFRDVQVVSRTDGTLVALFHNRFRLEAVQRDQPELELHSVVA